MVSIDLAKGNPGAIVLMAEAYKKDPFRAERCFQKMQDAGICGAKLYMLWNDCCGRDTEKMMDVIDREDVSVILEHLTDVYGTPFD